MLHYQQAVCISNQLHFLISLAIFYGFHTSVCVFLSTLLGLIKYRNVKGHFAIMCVWPWFTLISLSEVPNKKQSSKEIGQMWLRPEMANQQQTPFEESEKN